MHKFLCSRSDSPVQYDLNVLYLDVMFVLHVMGGCSSVYSESIFPTHYFESSSKSPVSFSQVTTLNEDAVGITSYIAALSPPLKGIYLYLQLSQHPK